MQIAAALLWLKKTKQTNLEIWLASFKCEVVCFFLNFMKGPSLPSLLVAPS